MLQNYAASNSYKGTKDTDYYTLTEKQDSAGTYNVKSLPLGVYLVVETEAPDSYVINTQSFLVAIPQWNQSANESEGEWVYSVSAYPKYQSISVDKVMKKADNDKATTTTDSYEIGDTIPYTVTATIPNYGYSTDYPELSVTHNLALNYKDGSGKADQPTGIKMYNNLGLLFTDTLSEGLRLNDLSGKTNGLTVTVAGTKLENGKEIIESDVNKITDENLTGDKKIYAALKAAGKTLTGATYVYNEENKLYTYTGTVETTERANYVYYSAVDDSTNKTTMYVYVPWCVIDNQSSPKELGSQGQKVVLDYSAYLTDKAEVGAENTNTVTYKFSNDPQSVSSTAYDPQSNNTDTTTVYTYGMELTKKFNGEDATTAKVTASGVTFQLQDSKGTAQYFYKSTDDTYTLYNKDAVAETTENNEEVYKVYTSSTATETAVTTQDINPTDKGKLTIKGLAAGTYKLVETKSVDGYSLLTAPVIIVVSENEEKIAEVTAKIKDSNSTGTTTVETLKTKAEANNTTTAADKATFVLTVNNSANQFNLPFTGGMGLWTFTITGGVIMSAAIIVLVVNRKKRASK